MSRLNSITLILLFKLCWFGSVLVGRSENALASLVFPLLLLCFLGGRGLLKRKLLILSVVVLFLGLLFEFLLIQGGFISVRGEALGQIPWWLVSLWLCFSLAMVRLAPNFKAPLWVAGALGAVMGPLSYRSGEYFEVLIFNSYYTMVFYALFWCLMFPFIIYFSRRFTCSSS